MKHQGDLNDSEPSLLLSLAEQTDEGFVVVALMGEGQEIHAGEESAIQNWIDAVRGKSGWSVIGPKHFEEDFVAAGIPYDSEQLFNLDVSLRSRKAGRLAAWVEQVISGNLGKAASIAEDLVKIGYPIRMSRNLENVKRYIRDRFDGLDTKRTGILVSSKFRNIDKFGITAAPNKFYYLLWPVVRRSPLSFQIRESSRNCDLRIWMSGACPERSRMGSSSIFHCYVGDRICGGMGINGGHMLDVRGS